MVEILNFDLSNTELQANWEQAPEIIAVSADNRKEIHQTLLDIKTKLSQSPDAEILASISAESRSTFSASHGFRLLIAVEPSDNPENAIAATADELEANTDTCWTSKICFYGEAACPGKLAFAFPGQGSQYIYMGRDLAACFREISRSISLADQSVNGPAKLADLIFPMLTGAENEKTLREEALRSTDIAQPAIGAVTAAMMRILHRFGIVPDSTCGHSYGELSALFAAGRFDEQTFFRLSAARGKYMREAGGTGDAGSMLAVKAPLEKIDGLIAASNLDIILANRNSPDQGVLSGPTAAIEQMKSVCRENKIRATVLPVSAAFHSKLVAAAAVPFEKEIASAEFLPSSIPVYSNTTGLPYPNDPARAKKALAGHLTNPVNFIKEIQNMHQDGIRIFVEVGPRAVLTGLTKTILKNQPAHILAMDASSGRRSGLMDLAKTLCTLASLGYPVTLEKWKTS